MPKVSDVWAVLDPLVGLKEQPPGSNKAPPITTWYGWDAAWCVMTESFALAQAGFSDDAGATLNLRRLIGITQTTPKGWAYVPYLTAAFRALGLFDQTPREGSLFVVGKGSHTGFVRDPAGAGGTFTTLEGNYGNVLANGRRRIADQAGFCHVPYTPGFATHQLIPSVPSFPGMLRRGSRGAAVRQLQGQMQRLGHRLSVDGVFGAVTHRTVSTFQRTRGLQVDGLVGPITWAALWTTTP